MLQDDADAADDSTSSLGEEEFVTDMDDNVSMLMAMLQSKAEVRPRDLMTSLMTSLVTS